MIAYTVAVVVFAFLSYVVINLLCDDARYPRYYRWLREKELEAEDKEVASKD
jgi:hypothetical protein